MERLGPPGDKEDVHQPLTWQPSLAFLRYTILTILVGSASYVLAIFLLVPDDLSRLTGPVLMSVVAVTGGWQIAHGKANQAVSTLAFGVWFTITVVSFFHGGVNSTLFYVYPLIIVVLGWLVNERVTVALTVLTSIVAVVYIAAANQGWLPAYRPAPLLLHGIVHLFVFFLSAVLVILMVRAYRRRLTELGRAGRDLQLVNNVLSQSETKFSTAFKSSPVAASIARASDGMILEVNDNFSRDFGWSRAELLHHTATDVGLWLTPQDRQVWGDALQRDGRIVNYETVWMHQDGAVRQISISGEIIELDNVPCILAFTTDITARKTAEQQIQNLAFFDPLTGLPNRRLLMDRLEQALASATRHQQLGALLFIDLDNFKILNDTHGHEKGDRLLQQVAQRLNECVREGDTVARLGGDEFVVMLEQLSAHALEVATRTEVVAEKIRAALNVPYALDGHTHHSSPSVGITLFGEKIESIEEPLKRADLAMYQAKAAGRDTVRFYDPEMQAVVFARAGLEQELRLALAQRQFVLHYQPQVDAQGRVIGAEALVRWDHPQRGMVPPGTFIGLAEDSALILPLGEQVLEMACAQLAQWASTPTLRDLIVAVNVSPRQFHQRDFVQQIVRILDRSGAPASRLKLELTESVLVSNFDDVIAKMSALKSRGVSFSLDDFGTGYSSLVYLKRLPLDQLKIDQSFVRDILVDANDAAIARMVIVLADSLGLAVIAEGVETEAQRDALQQQGCLAYQGYLFGRPQPAHQLEQQLRL